MKQVGGRCLFLERIPAIDVEWSGFRVPIMLVRINHYTSDASKVHITVHFLLPKLTAETLTVVTIGWWFTNPNKGPLHSDFLGPQNYPTLTAILHPLVSHRFTRQKHLRRCWDDISPTPWRSATNFTCDVASGRLSFRIGTYFVPFNHFVSKYQAY